MLPAQLMTRTHAAQWMLLVPVLQLHEAAVLLATEAPQERGFHRSNHYRNQRVPFQTLVIRDDNVILYGVTLSAYTRTMFLLAGPPLCGCPTTSCQYDTTHALSAPNAEN